jgi:hypothetical protein
MDISLIVLCIFALPAPFILFYEWRIRKQQVMHHHKRRSCLVMITLAVLESVSIGAFWALIGFGLGRIITFYSSYRSFGGIIGISSCFLVWSGFAGFVGGFGLALRRMTGELESEE